MAPGTLSRAFGWLSSPRHKASRVACASLVYMLSPIPRRGAWDHRFCSCSPNHVSLPRKRGSGRPAHRPFRGLLGVYSRYGLHTRHVTVFRDALLTRGFNRFVTSTVAPVASGWSISPGGTLTHWKAPPFHGAPPKRTPPHLRHGKPIQKSGLPKKSLKIPC